MPHVIVKLWPGTSEAAKEQLAAKIVSAVTAATGSSKDSVSVAIDEVLPQDWMAQVYHPEIAPRMTALYKKPGYKPF